MATPQGFSAGFLLSHTIQTDSRCSEITDGAFFSPQNGRMTAGSLAPWMGDFPGTGVFEGDTSLPKLPAAAAVSLTDLSDTRCGRQSAALHAERSDRPPKGEERTDRSSDQ